MQTTRRTRHTLWLLVPVVLALSVVVLAPTSSSEAREWDSDEHNVLLIVPDEPGAWAWLNPTSTWGKQGIVKGASRYLDKLKSGKSATYEGGIVHLYKLPATEETTLDTICSDAETRAKLLKRFEGSPEVEITDTKLNDDLPAKLLIVEGKARNKLGEPTPAQGRMLITVARGFVYLLRMYVWHTEYDDEGLKIDLDYIEGEFMIKKTKAKEKTPEKPPKDPVAGPAAEDDEGKEEEVQLREQLFRLTKHKKINQKEVTDDSMLLFFEDVDSHGWYQIILYATKNGRVINGVKAPDENIKKGITETWWKNFSANHPDGELWTFRWPKRMKAPTFITLPDLSDDARKIVSKKGKRPIAPKASDMIKKMKFIQKVKDKQLGKKYRVGEPYRGVLQGNRPRAGKETVLRFAWRTAFFSFRLIVTVGGQAYDKWGDAIRSTLESMHHYKD